MTQQILSCVPGAKAVSQEYRPVNEVDRAGACSYCRLLVDGFRAVSMLPTVDESPLTLANSAANHRKPANLLAMNVCFLPCNCLS